MMKESLMVDVLRLALRTQAASLLFVMPVNVVQAGLSTAFMRDYFSSSS